jgi:hypothetical protein
VAALKNAGYTYTAAQDFFSGGRPVSLTAERRGGATYADLTGGFWNGTTFTVGSVNDDQTLDSGDDPPPGTTTMEEAQVDGNYVLIDVTGTQSWRPVPHYTTNLVTGPWQEVPGADWSSSYPNLSNSMYRLTIDAAALGSNIYVRVITEDDN